jgi:aminopeptidase-like protein
MLEFIPWGYDERQFCSPGINLPMGRLTRTPNGEFPEYHTSADNPAFLTPAELGEAWHACLQIFEVLEQDRRCLNLQPYGEPQLGRRGLYRTTGGHQDVPERQLALLWVLNQSDGSASLLDIAEKSGLPFRVIAAAAQDLESCGLLGPAEMS